MNMKAVSFAGWLILVLAAAPCLADRIPTVTASTNMGSGFSTDIQNTVNGAGLSSLSLTATHAGTSPFNSWVSSGTLTGTVTFDFGATFLVDSFSFWNQNGGGPGLNGTTGIQGVAVSTSTDGITFTPLSGGPASFAQVTAVSAAPPEIFVFTPQLARFFRFTILSNYGDFVETAFAEAGFDFVVPPAALVPTLSERGLLLLTILLCGIGGLVLRKYPITARPDSR